MAASLEVRAVKVVVIVLNYSGLVDTLECIESLRCVTSEHRIKVSVLDNGSSQDESEPIREKLGELGEIFRSSTNLGFAAGCNLLISNALREDADYVLLLNNDTIVSAEFVDELVRVAEGDPRIGIVGAKIYCYSAPKVIWSTGGYVNWWLGEITSVDEYRSDHETRMAIEARDWVSGCGMLVKRELFDKLSLFDEDFFQGGEDYEFCTRALRAGYRVVYAPSAKVWHKISASKAALIEDPDSLRRFVQSEGIGGIKTRLRFFRKCAVWPPAVIPMTLTLLYSFPKYVAIQLLVHRRGGAVWAALRRWVVGRLLGSNASHGSGRESS